MAHSLPAIKQIKDDFFISIKDGFLIDTSKVHLPPCWRSYEELAKNITQMVEKQELRYLISKLNDQNLTFPGDKRMLLKLHTILSFISAGYVWQNGDKDVANVLPRCLAVPLVRVSDKLGIQPIVSYPSMILANWKISKENGTMATIFNTPGGEGTDWFILAHVQIEKSFAPVIKAIEDAIKYSQETDSPNFYGFIKALEVIPPVLTKMAEHFERINDGVDPLHYYNSVRIFLSGWGWGNPPLPEGLLYDGVDKSPKMMKGGSAAQSSTLQVLDAALGVEYRGEELKFFEEARSYMLTEHRHFYDYIKQNSMIRKFAIRHSSNESVKDAYNACIKALTGFRQNHMSLVNRYITEPSRLQQRNRNVDSIRKRGAGGTPYMTFLNNVRRQTAKAKIPDEA